MTREDLARVMQLVDQVCRESGHGQVTIRVRDGVPVLFEKVVTEEPPSRRLVTA